MRADFCVWDAEHPAELACALAQARCASVVVAGVPGNDVFQPAHRQHCRC
jgi:hypothetical protein